MLHLHKIAWQVCLLIQNFVPDTLNLAAVTSSMEEADSESESFLRLDQRGTLMS